MPPTTEANAREWATSRASSSVRRDPSMQVIGEDGAGGVNDSLDLVHAPEEPCHGLCHDRGGDEGQALCKARPKARLGGPG